MVSRPVTHRTSKGRGLRAVIFDVPGGRHRGKFRNSEPCQRNRDRRQAPVHRAAERTV